MSIYVYIHRRGDFIFGVKKAPIIYLNVYNSDLRLFRKSFPSDRPNFLRIANDKMYCETCVWEFTLNNRTPRRYQQVLCKHSQILVCKGKLQGTHFTMATWRASPLFEVKNFNLFKSKSQYAKFKYNLL